MPSFGGLALALLLTGTDGGWAHTGGIDKKALRKVMREEWPKLRPCWEIEGLSKPPPSKVVVEFVIELDGRVSSAEISNGPLDAPPSFGECLLRGVRQLKAPKPKGGTVRVVYPFIVDFAGF